MTQLKELSLLRYRGCRGGKKSAKKISVINTGRRKSRKTPNNCNYKHLEVARKWYDLPSLLLSNVTSLNNKLDEFIVTVDECNCDVAAITECWQITPEISRIKDFDFYYHQRSDRRGGGVALYARKKLCAIRLDV